MAPLESFPSTEEVDYSSDETTPLLSRVVDKQTRTLSKERLRLVFFALTLILFTSTLDQTALSTSLPAIASGVSAGSSISWVAVSFLTTSTSIQLVNGHLSDIFGRKRCLIISVTIMGVGNLLSGFSQTPLQLYGTRAFSGFGAGAINALVQIIITDITTPEQRGFYYGILGTGAALGYGLGPVIGGALTENISWRLAFWFVCPLAAVAVTSFTFVYPKSRFSENAWAKFRKVDWLGAVTSISAVILILVCRAPPCLPNLNVQVSITSVTDSIQIPISEGGSRIPWTSPIITAMLVSGLALFISFLIFEYRVAKIPILPCGSSLLTVNYSLRISC